MEDRRRTFLGSWGMVIVVFAVFMFFLYRLVAPALGEESDLKTIADGLLSRDLSAIETEEDVIRMVKPYIHLYAAAKKGCEAGNKKDCEAAHAMDYKTGQLLTLVDNKALWRDPKTWRNKFCSAYEKANIAKSNVEDEREKGKISGVVNLRRLKSWGDMVHEQMKAMREYGDKYAEMTGTGIKGRDCD